MSGSALPPNATYIQSKGPRDALIKKLWKHTLRLIPAKSKLPELQFTEVSACDISQVIRSPHKSEAAIIVLILQMRKVSLKILKVLVQGHI